LIVPESSGAFELYSFVYQESLKVRMFRWKLDDQKLGDKEEAFFEYADKLHESE
jgi:hypothetical protein